MSLKAIQRWISHPSYAFVCIGIGFIFWLFSFEFSPKPQVQSLQLSSVAYAKLELQENEYHALQNISNSELTAKLEKIKPKWSRVDQDYALSLSALEGIERKSKKQLPKRFENNPVFQLLENMTNNVVSVEYEDLLVCDRSRQFYEDRISTSPLLKKMAEIRNVPRGEMSAQCVTYSMRQIQLPKMNYANCSQSLGMPQVPGSKPCVTPNMVNLTYNAFMDITNCLNLEAKHLMPKIDFESGFFLNAYGQDREGGVGQLTRAAIAEVNNYFQDYMIEIEKAAATKNSCANLLKYKNNLTMASANPEQRCSVMGLPENPMRNILYMALLTRINLDKLNVLFKNKKIEEKLAKLGLKDIDMNFFKDTITLLGYNTGIETAATLLSSYLDQRIANNLPLSWSDFDFYANPRKTDLDGKEKTLVELARSYVFSSIIDPKDSAEVKLIKTMKRKEFPRLWAEAFAESFPVYITYRANNYNGVGVDKYSIFGYPGYLNLIAERNQNIQTLFANSDLDPNLCVDQHYLKTPNLKIMNVQN